jgi:hypothetical protein
LLTNVVITYIKLAKKTKKLIPYIYITVTVTLMFFREQAHRYLQDPKEVDSKRSVLKRKWVPEEDSVAGSSTGKTGPKHVPKSSKKPSASSEPPSKKPDKVSYVTELNKIT